MKTKISYFKEFETQTREIDISHHGSLIYKEYQGTCDEEEKLVEKIKEDYLFLFKENSLNKSYLTFDGTFL